MARFEREARAADPDASDAEIARRAQAAHRAHMTRLALASSKARKAGRVQPDRQNAAPRQGRRSR